MEEYVINFLLSVAASIVAYYACKWLDGNDNDGDQPKD